MAILLNLVKSCLYNKVSRVDTRSDSDNADDHLHGMAFAQLVSYMEEFRTEEDTAPVHYQTQAARGQCGQPDSEHKTENEIISLIS